MLDAVVHGCIPVVIEDESLMFFEGAFAEASEAGIWTHVTPRVPAARAASCCC